MITAKSNQQLKRIGQLLRKRSAREEEQAFVIEGRKMFFELLRDYPELLQRAFFSESGLAGLSDTERELACSYPYEIVRDDIFASAAETVTPQGVLAIVSMPERSLNDLTAAGKGLLLLEKLTLSSSPGDLDRGKRKMFLSPRKKAPLQAVLTHFRPRKRPVSDTKNTKKMPEGILPPA